MPARIHQNFETEAGLWSIALEALPTLVSFAVDTSPPYNLQANVQAQQSALYVTPLGRNHEITHRYESTPDSFTSSVLGGVVRASPYTNSYYIGYINAVGGNNNAILGKVTDGVISQIASIGLGGAAIGNTLTLRAVDQHIELYVNGVLVTRHYEATPLEGYYVGVVSISNSGTDVFHQLSVGPLKTTPPALVPTGEQLTSARQLTGQLINLRLSAQNNSLWNFASTIEQRALRAVNDAIEAYEFKVSAVYTSLHLDTTNRVWVLPADISHITKIEGIGSHTLIHQSRREIRDWVHQPTLFTNLLYMNELEAARYQVTTDWFESIEVTYELKQPPLPADVFVVGSLESWNATAVFTSGEDIPSSYWPSPGFFEVTALNNTTAREVVRYELALPTGFTNLTRAVNGVPVTWSGGARVSPIYRASPRTIPVIQAKAQAVMYEYWMQDRASYEKYTAIASEQAVDLADLLGLSRTYEDKADRLYDRIKPGPAVGRVEVRVRRP